MVSRPATSSLPQPSEARAPCAGACPPGTSAAAKAAAGAAVGQLGGDAGEGARFVTSSVGRDEALETERDGAHGDPLKGQVEEDLYRLASVSTAAESPGYAASVGSVSTVGSLPPVVEGIQSWDAGRFTKVRKLQDAPQNRGAVFSMRDAVDGELVAVKTMPNEWVCDSHEAFEMKHPDSHERPWADIECTAFLNSAAFPYACQLRGVFFDDFSTHVVMDLASDGDLFSWVSDPRIAPPGLERESLVRPMAAQIVDAVRWLHDLSVVHGDISTENILLTRACSGGVSRVKVIDFAQCSRSRVIRNRVSGKASYRAPEAFEQVEYDGFLSDAFAVGVTLYGALVQNYPWLATCRPACKSFEYFRRNGFAAWTRQKKVYGRNCSVMSCMSQAVAHLLAGLLAIDPAERLTLGEREWSSGSSRRSAWQEAWLQPPPGQLAHAAFLGAVDLF